MNMDYLNNIRKLLNHVEENVAAGENAAAIFLKTLCANAVHSLIRANDRAGKRGALKDCLIGKGCEAGGIIALTYLRLDPAPLGIDILSPE